MDYIKELRRNPVLLLVEDDEVLRREYKKSLKNAGFRVVDIDDGIKLENTLMQISFDVILSDTDMMGLSGDLACKNALEKKLIGEDTLLIAMSDDSNNEVYWAEVAHHFIDKRTSRDFGEMLMSHYYNYKTQGGIWRMRKQKRRGR
jgi:CheY-like chemotaxis protein